MNYRGGRVVCQERAPHLKPYYLSVSQDGERKSAMDSFTRAAQDTQKPQGVRVAWQVRVWWAGCVTEPTTSGWIMTESEWASSCSQILRSLKHDWLDFVYFFQLSSSKSSYYRNWCSLRMLDIIIYIAVLFRNLVFLQVNVGPKATKICDWLFTRLAGHRIAISWRQVAIVFKTLLQKSYPNRTQG